MMMPGPANGQLVVTCGSPNAATVVGCRVETLPRIRCLAPPQRMVRQRRRLSSCPCQRGYRHHGDGEYQYQYRGGRGRKGSEHQWWDDDWMGSGGDREEIVTIFCQDGTVTTFPPCVMPVEDSSFDSSFDSSRSSSLSSLSSSKRRIQPLPSVDEQGLCMGSLFTISATNGSDVSRRINVSGFCQSIDHLCESVEGAIYRRGGEIMAVSRDSGTGDGLCESLTMALALPLLWGVPPEYEKLRRGIQRGGGIIHKIYKEWFIL